MLGLDADLDREENAYLLSHDLDARSESFAREKGHRPDPEGKVSYDFYNRIAHVTDENCERRNGK